VQIRVNSTSVSKLSISIMLKTFNINWAYTTIRETPPGTPPTDSPTNHQSESY